MHSVYFCLTGPFFQNYPKLGYCTLGSKLLGIGRTFIGQSPNNSRGVRLAKNDFRSVLQN